MDRKKTLLKKILSYFSLWPPIGHYYHHFKNGHFETALYQDPEAVFLCSKDHDTDTWSKIKRYENVRVIDKAVKQVNLALHKNDLITIIHYQLMVDEHYTTLIRI